MYLGSAPPGIFPRGDQHCAQGGPAAYSGDRAQKCIADFVRPPVSRPILYIVYSSFRRQQHLGMAELKRMGVVLKRAQYFITCNGRAAAHGTRQEIAAALLDPKAFAVGTQQLSLDDFTPKVLPDTAPAVQKLAAAGMPARQAAYEVKQEALQCLTRRM